MGNQIHLFMSDTEEKSQKDQVVTASKPSKPLLISFLRVPSSVRLLIDIVVVTCLTALQKENKLS